MTCSVDAAAAAEYYSKREHLLYYLPGEAGVGEWFGGAAAVCGFRGKVTLEALRAAFEGYGTFKGHPRQLVQFQEGKKRQPAWDLTYSAPKCLSVMWSMASPEWRHRIEQILMKATKRALLYLEENALHTRRGKYGARIEKAKGIFALIPHATSRAGDQQLHIHALAINACQRKDSSTGTIRSHDLYLHKMAAGAVFHLELAYLLFKELGIVTVPDKENPWTFKIPGVSEDLCKEVSKRREEILKLATEEGWDSPKVMALLAVATRKAKSDVTLAECFAKWQATGREFGFSTAEADRLLAHGQERLDSISRVSECKESRKANLVKAVDKAIEKIATHDAYFPERKVIQETNTLVQGRQYKAKEVVQVVKERLEQRLIQIEIPAQAEYKFFSTKENIAAEKELIERVEKGKNSTKHLVKEEIVERAINKQEQVLSKALGVKAEFTPDQKRGTKYATLENGDTKLINGGAGAGKTLMLSAAHRAWKEQGLTVLGCAMTGRAAKVLNKQTSIPSVTIAALLHTLRPDLTPKHLRQTFGEKLNSIITAERREATRAGRWMQSPLQQAFREVGWAIRDAFRGRNAMADIKLTEKTVLVVDEVPTLPTKAFLLLKQECDKAGAKLVGVGDRYQLPPIEAGSAFWSLANITGCESLTTIVRQRHQWMRDAIESILADRPMEALQTYAKHDSLHIAKHKTAAIEKVVERYSQIKPAALPHLVALTTTNKDADLINKAVQQKRKAAKQLGLRFATLGNNSRVYVGDIVTLRENNYQINVMNGMRGTVVGISHQRGLVGPAAITIQLHGEKQGPLALWRPRTVTIDLKTYEKLQLGYALTTNLSQGSTFQETLVLVGENNSRNMIYTQLTRHSDRCTIYATEAEYGDSLQYLAKQISRKNDKDLASDYRLKQTETETTLSNKLNPAELYRQKIAKNPRSKAHVPQQRQSIDLS